MGVAQRHRDILRRNRWSDLYSLRASLPPFQRQCFLKRCLCLFGFGVDIRIHAGRRIELFMAVAESIFQDQITLGFGCDQPLSLGHSFNSDDRNPVRRCNLEGTLPRRVAWGGGILTCDHLSRSTHGPHESNTFLERVRPLVPFTQRRPGVRMRGRHFIRRSGSREFDLSRLTLGLLVVQGLSLLIYIIMGSQGSKAAQTSVGRLIKGHLFFIFMIGATGIGLVVPSVLYIIDIISSSAPMLYVGSGLILIGGIFMRYSLIASGVKTPMLSEDSIGATYWLYH